ncbi:hypothetical protein BDR03DRAFT_1018342 [Suillus americanus]|nr:hypothetical protein BDR03DRAFT_1018342 [Suillus americanus]
MGLPVQFPVQQFFCIAVYVLPAQASSVPSERVFPSGKETSTDQSAHLLPTVLEAMSAELVVVAGKLVQLLTNNMRTIDYAVATFDH